MKRFLMCALMFVAIFAVCIALQPTEAQAASVEDLSFTLNSDGKGYSVRVASGKYPSGELTIPSTYNGLPVTTIGYNAFSYNRSLTSITIPASVTTIDEWSAFDDCSNLTGIWVDAANPNYSSDSFGVLFNKNKTELLRAPGALQGSYTVPDSVTTIGNGAFDNCSRLTGVTFGKSVTTIGNSVFNECDSLTNVTIPDNVTTIGDYVFDECYFLISATIGNGVTTIGNGMFRDCYKLTSVTIGNGVTTIGSSAFDECDSLTNIYITDIAAWCGINFYDVDANPLHYADNLYLNGKLVTSLTIPQGVTEIGYSAFSNYTRLASVTIPDSVTTIGSYSFYNCTGLTNVTIGNSVTTIGSSAFYNCSRLPSVTIPDSVTTIGDEAFYSCKSLTSVTIPNSVTTIGEGAFYNCTSLTNVTIGNSVTTIGDEAFYNCKSLTSVTIPNSVTTIGSYAFRYCTGLTSVTIPDSVTVIGNQAFFNCTNLTSVTIPDSVTTIRSSAFSGCSKLIRVDITDIAAWCGISFSSSDSNPLYYAKNLYLNGKLVTDLVIPDSVSSIGYYAFYNCTSLTSVTIPESVTTIDYCAFRNCAGLTSVIIPDSVTSVGSSAFSGCTSLTYNVYDNAKYLGSADNPYAVLIEACSTSISSCEIHPETRLLAGNAFYSCKSLTSVDIPSSVTAIGISVFRDCTSLTDVYYTGTRTQWDAISVGNSNNYLLNATLHLADHCTAYGHTEVIIPGRFATCMQEGLTDGKVCSVCDAVLQAQEVIPTGDHLEVIIPGEPATCTKSGISDGVGCEECGEILVFPEEIPALGHTEEVVPGEAATCTDTGLTDGKKCVTCGKTLLAQEEIPALGHSEEIIPGKAATCTETGLTDGKRCTVCGTVTLAQETVPAAGHTENIISGFAPTCTETGLTDGMECTVCGEVLTEQEEISALGHTEEIIPAVAPTCTETGLSEGKKCSVCGEILLAQSEISATGHTYDHEFDGECNGCSFVRELNNTFNFVNFRVVFEDLDTTHMNPRAVIYKLGNNTVEDPTNEKALQAIDANAVTKWGARNINRILLTDAGNYVVLLKYNVGTDTVKIPMVLNISADPKLIIDENNKITVIDNDEQNTNHRAVVYYLGENTVEDVYDTEALKAIDPEAKTHWQKLRINRLALTKGGNYVLHLEYNVGSEKRTVAQQFTVFSIPNLKVDQNNMLIATEENSENKNHRVTVFYLGDATMEDPFDETAVKNAAISSKTYWGLSSINKVEITEGGNYVIHLYYNVGTSAKRTLALDVTLNDRPELSVDESGKLVVECDDPAISNYRAFIYNVGDAEVEDIYDETALKAIATPSQSWGLSAIAKKTLTSGTYVIHLHYNVNGGAKSTVALKVTIQ